MKFDHVNLTQLIGARDEYRRKALEMPEVADVLEDAADTLEAQIKDLQDAPCGKCRHRRSEHKGDQGLCRYRSGQACLCHNPEYH